MDTTKAKRIQHFFKIFEDINRKYVQAKSKDIIYFKKLGKLVAINKKIWIYPLFLCRITIDNICFSFDLIKDICFVVLLLEKMAPLKWLSFEYTICFLLALSIVLPLACNLLLVLSMYISKYNLWAFAVSLALFFPIAPCIVVYICNRLDSSIKGTEESTNRKSVLLSCKNKIKLLALKMKLNENAIENPMQISILLLIFCISDSKTSSITGLQNLFVGRERVLTFFSIFWSLCSMTYGHIRWIGARKSICLPWYGMIFHGIFVILTLTERISAIFIYFSPPLGLFDLLGHWKKGKMTFKNSTVEEILINEEGIISELGRTWLPLEKYEDLTFWPLKTYFNSATVLLLIHLLLTTLIKCYTAIQFRSNKSKIEKILHLITQITCPLFHDLWKKLI